MIFCPNASPLPNFSSNYLDFISAIAPLVIAAIALSVALGK
ncbi:hypothetical protein [Anabaena sp. UHCC 0253]|nr:hypothetical protein [Anabaena sp. UHCC 0253]